MLLVFCKSHSKALDRFTSSPWSDPIDIMNMEKVSDSEYRVEGEAVEVTSEENDEEPFLKYSITLIVKSKDDNWPIDE
mgnify:CR=1 FL=1